ncbi:DUF2711 family protein [Domibacillus iocasae]|uniref:DUF2711 domain-containing protein n=1 Tax=Domibacillus iocasae TaxID=1714016 RepID=A0A1E7DQY3_9BACI|nr:DUF2711 family protein [Domibacillus iocasae]OES45449.1 hypothetical protein BA724_17510 [Domibacillus iocasae]
MLDYIWLNDKSSILKQLPGNFKSAALLLHPFVQMPSGWEKTIRKNSYQHIYPSDEEIITLGKCVPWRKMISDSGLNSYKELALALITSIGAFNKEYERKDLANKLNLNLNPDFFYPTEDSTSVFLMDSLLKVIGSKGAKKLYFSDPISDNNGLLNINDTSSLDICNLSGLELIVADENTDYGFMSLYDSFTTLLFAKDESIEDIVQLMNWEAIICDQKTSIDWYM